MRRALASNRFAETARTRLAEQDPALEVRARAEGALSAHGELGEGERIVDTARFAAALRCFSTGGVLAPDVARALSTGPERLDPAGLIWAAQVRPRADPIVKRAGYTVHHGGRFEAQQSASRAIYVMGAGVRC